MAYKIVVPVGLGCVAYIVAAAGFVAAGREIAEANIVAVMIAAVVGFRVGTID